MEKSYKIYPYYLASFLSAFLLFQIQPMAAKAILPLFGGSNLVWAACMVFFQGCLLIGYIYAHIVQKKMGTLRYAPLHEVFLFLPFFFFPFSFSNITTLPLSLGEFFSVFILLSRTIGLPFLVLSTSSLILQKWLSVSLLPQKNNPYVLYSASNLGSLSGLLTYPVIFEPAFDLKFQGYLWWSGYTILIALTLFCFPYKGKEEKKEETSHVNHLRAPYLRWFFLSAGACALLLATTNIITFDVASVPFLWVLPLSLYLFTFVLTFQKKSWYPFSIPRFSYLGMIIGITLYSFARVHIDLPLLLSTVLYLVILFVICLDCHGRLIRMKPKSHHNLTLFYVAISCGGLMGSFFISFIIPKLSTSPIEYLFAFILCCIAFAFSESTRKDHKSSFLKTASPVLVSSLLAAFSLVAIPWLFKSHFQEGQKIMRFVIFVIPALTLLFSAGKPWSFALIILTVAFSINQTPRFITGSTTTVMNLRNFYGIYRVFDKDGIRYIHHGTVRHGKQYLTGEKKSLPLSYYHPSAPAGELLSKKEMFSFKKIGMIGLGAGSLAAYFSKGDTFTIFELDPDNVTIAETYFTYLDKARKRGVSISIHTGDGRINLQKEPGGSYDLLIIDAFTSDAIPVHLLTVEAFQEYFRVLKPSGTLLVHISNKMLSLHPIVLSIAQELNIPAAIKSAPESIPLDADFCRWAALSKDQNKIDFLYEKMGWAREKKGRVDLPRPWTDRYSNLFNAIIMR